MRVGAAHAIRRREETRFDTWLWLEARKESVNIPIESFGIENLRQFLIGFMFEQRIDQMIEFGRNRRILPIERLEWIKDDKRQVNWLLDYTANILKVNFYPIPPRLFGKDLLLARIDCYNIELGYKLSAVERMRDEWNEYQKSDIIFEWFKGEEEAARCAYAWDWLVKRMPRETYGKAAITSYPELLGFYDMTGVNAAQKELDVKKISRNWNQQKGRENQKDKKQYNFPLTHQAIADLNSLAKQYKVSRPQIIEALIKMEAAQGYYLPQKVKKTLLD